MVEFEGLLSEEQAKLFFEHAKKTISLRLSIKPGDLFRKPPEEIFLHGRDLFRDDSIIQKEVCRRQYAEIVSELIDQPILRIAFDQLILSTKHPRYSQNLQTPFQQWVDHPASLKEACCISEILCGVIFCLWKEMSEGESPLSLFPSKAGNAVFFSPAAPIPFHQLHEKEDALFLMFAYCHPRAAYLLQPKDPNTHALKSFGYVFGDSLLEKFHPIAYRRNT